MTLKELLQETGIKQTVLAKRFGMDITTLSRIVSNEEKLNDMKEYVERIRQAIG